MSELSIIVPRITLPKRILYSIRRVIYNKDIRYKNVEGIEEYFFILRAARKPTGSSVMLRAKNEEDCIEDCIRSIYDAFDEIVFIDNDSEDNTLSLVNRFKTSFDKNDKINIYTYPFSVARCGDEHLSTDPNSIHSLVYYYNWCLSRLRFNYVIKWDADMILMPEAKDRLMSCLANIQSSEIRLEIPVRTAYIDSRGNFYEAINEVNIDDRIFPNRPYIRYKKADLWEVLYSDYFIPQMFYPEGDIYEIKDTRKDEFSHWTSTNFTSTRKIKEWENYNKVRNGEIDTEFKKIESMHHLFI